MSKTNAKKILCPRCGSDTYHWGHDSNFRHMQRYRCRNPKCRRQFVPGRPKRQTKYPQVNCPKCGTPMSIFKHLSDGYRMRCNRHSAKGKLKCSHKINIPLPGKQLNMANDPLESIKVSIAVCFAWNKMSFSKETVSLAIYFSVFKAIPATEIAEIFKELYRIHISHDTITRWTHKAVLTLHKNLGPLSVPKSRKKKLFTDETVFKQKGQKRWLWLAKESKFDAVSSWFLSPRRSTEYARSTFNIAFSNSPSLRNSYIVTDGLWSYGSALGDLGFDLDKKHLVYKGFYELTNNNRLERHWSTLKVRARRYRGFKSERGLWCFITGQLYLHNYFQPNKRLKGLTPAEAAGKKLPYCLSKWKLLTIFI